MPEQTKIENKEKELIEKFNKQFPYKIQTAPPHKKLQFINKEIMEFILAHRKAELEEIMTVIAEKRKMELYSDWYSGYNQCLQDVLQIIKSKI